jgi:hypothetical protein
MSGLTTGQIGTAQPGSGWIGSRNNIPAPTIAQDIFPVQGAAHYDVITDLSTRAVFSFGGNLFLFVGDTLSGTSGGGTRQIFIYESTDHGVTWTNITPVAPVKLEDVAELGLLFTQVNNVVYCGNMSNGGSNLFWKIFRFNLGTQAWLSNSPTLIISTTTADQLNNWPVQAAVRQNGQIVYATGVYDGTGGGANIVVYFVYDSVTNSFPAPGAITIPGLINQAVLAAGQDSADRSHFWVAADNTGATYFSTLPVNIQHFVIRNDGTVGAITTVVNNAAGNGTGIFGNWYNCSLPVFWQDAITKAQMMGVLIALNNTSLTLYSAVEAESPVWSTLTVVSVLGGAMLANSNTSVMFAASMIAIPFTNAVEVDVFWQEGIAGPHQGYVKMQAIRNGVLFGTVKNLFSGVMYNSIAFACDPGPVFPVLVSNTGTTAVFGGMFPLQNGTTHEDEYAALSLWFFSVTSTDIGPGGGGSSILPLSAATLVTLPNARLVCPGSAPRVKHRQFQKCE